MGLANERELLKRIKKDPQAFALIYDENYKPIFSYIFRRLANYHVARDVTAETFLKAYQRIGYFEWRNVPISAWLFRIATNEVNQYVRTLRYRPVCINEAHLQLPVEEGIETEKAAWEKAVRENREFSVIQTQLLLLDTKYQDVIALRFFEGRSIKEISTILRKKEGTIKSLLSRGLEKLRTKVSTGL